MQKYLIRFYLLFLAAFFPVLSAIDTYHLETMNYPGGIYNVVMKTNSSGKSVGYFGNGFAPQLYTHDPESGFKDLEVIGNYTVELNFRIYAFYEAPFLNDLGQVAYDYEMFNWLYPDYYIFFDDPVKGSQHITPPKDPRWKNKVMKVTSLNQHGQMLVLNARRPETTLSTAFAIWHADQFTVYQVKNFSALYLNNQQEVFGKYLSERDGDIYGIFNLNDQTIRPVDISRLPSDSIRVRGFNDNGMVIGRFYNKYTYRYEGFVWSPEEGMKILETLIPISLNNKNQVLAWYDPQDFGKWEEMVIYEKGKIYFLKALLDEDPQSQGWRDQYFSFHHINDDGVISGRGAFWSGSLQGIILKPKR